MSLLVAKICQSKKSNLLRLSSASKLTGSYGLGWDLAAVLASVSERQRTTKADVPDFGHTSALNERDWPRTD
jgi:hypothetical protein